MKNYKGQLEGFPEEIVEKMLERQVEQGNGRDITVFEKSVSNSSKGFVWELAIEGDLFWINILKDLNFELFFKRYPKQKKIKKIKKLKVKKEDVRNYNIGKSDYSKHKIQPWDIWIEYNLNPFDADIVKRVLRDKEGESRRLDYEKIIHVCQERIRQFDNESEKT